MSLFYNKNKIRLPTVVKIFLFCFFEGSSLDSSSNVVMKRAAVNGDTLN
jgi:hypothetical protein